MRILLIEDDTDIGSGIEQALSRHGFAVDWFTDGQSGQAAPTAATYDAAVLDLGLPGVDGLEILSHWRRHNTRLPVLILTARDAIPDRIAGLDAGADDYVGKPFSTDEMIARLHALIRRQHGNADNRLSYGALSFDVGTHQAWLNDEPLALGQKALLLLELLLTHQERILSRAQIEDKLYGWDSDIDSNTIEVHIHSLRKQFGKNFIKTRRGLGYQLWEKP